MEGKVAAADPLAELVALGRSWVAEGQPSLSEAPHGHPAHVFADGLTAALETIASAGPVYWRGTNSVDEWAEARAGHLPSLEVATSRALPWAIGARYVYVVRGTAVDRPRSGATRITGIRVVSDLLIAEEAMRLPDHFHGGAVEFVTEVAHRIGTTADRVLGLVRGR